MTPKVRQCFVRHTLRIAVDPETVIVHGGRLNEAHNAAEQKSLSAPIPQASFAINKAVHRYTTLPTHVDLH